MNKKLESDYKRQLVSAIKDAGGYARRIEDQYAVGILDLILLMPGTEMVVGEAKRFTNRSFSPTPRQLEEMRRVVKAGGKVLTIGIKNETFYFHGFPLHTSGNVYDKECVVQQPGESLAAAYLRWYGETYERKIETVERRDNPVQRGAGGDEPQGEPARERGELVRDDWEPLVGVHPVIDETPKG